MADPILTERQIRLLEAVSGNAWMRDRFYLTGGTALAEFYLHHRHSEDLDFFSEEEFDVMQIEVFFKSHKGAFGYTSIDSQSSFNRNIFFLRFADETLKTEFTYFPFPRIEEGKTEHGVSIDSLPDIAVNKLFTIHQNPRARDFIDLFCICRQEGYTLSDLALKARTKFDWHIDPLQLGMQLLKATEVRDEPRMIQEIETDQWQQFFIEEARKLKPDILE